MSILRFLRASAAAALLSLAGCSDPEKEANKLLVEAANLVRDVASATPMQRYGALLEAEGKLRKLTSADYATTGAAVRVASGEKIGGKSIEEIRTALRRTAAEKEVCATLRTRACVVDHVVGTTMDSAADPKRVGFAFILAAQLQAAGMGAEAVKAADTAKQTLIADGRNPQTISSAGNLLVKAADRQLPAMLRREGPEAVVGYVERIVTMTDAADRDGHRKDLLETASTEIDVAAEPALAVAFAQAIANPDAKGAVVRKMLDTCTPYRRENASRIDTLLLPLQAFLDPEARRYKLKDWVRVADPKQFEALLTLADTPKSKSEVRYAYLQHHTGDLPPEQWLAMAAALEPTEQRYLRENFLDQAIVWRAKPAFSKEALARARAFSNTSQHADDNEAFRSKSAVVERLAGQVIEEADLDALLDIYALRRKTSWASLAICHSMSSYLPAAGRPDLLPRAAAACLDVYAAMLEVARDKYNASVKFAIADEAPVIWKLGRKAYDAWKADLERRNLFIVAYDRIGAFISNMEGEEAKAEGARILADPRASQWDQEMRRSSSLAAAISRNAPDVMSKWDEIAVASGKAPSWFFSVPERRGQWSNQTHGFFRRWVAERPEAAGEFLRKEMDGYASRSAVTRLDADDLSLLLDTLFKEGKYREIVINTAITQGLIGKGGLSYDLPWQTTTEGNWFTIHLASMLAAGLPKT